MRIRKRHKQAVTRSVTLLVLGILVFVVGQAAWGLYGKYRIASEREEEAEEEVEELGSREAYLKAELDRLSTERGIEEEIRRKFQVAKPGERTVILVEPKEKEEQTREDVGWWEKIKSFFGF